MKSSLAIQTHELGKQYSIGRKESYSTIRESVARLVTSPFGAGRAPQPKIWALRDVSFQVECGEVLGIIGKNGSGKTTLLKILSRITEPTTGLAKIRGRVSSLLEVGTGFHQELSGRENIFLNGAILGMTRKEIMKKFDEIVDFSGVEKFLDTPVKRYSSGMYVRLAFAVAAHLNPEILLVDEVLAVGDIEFQKKSLKKMNELTTKHGRTVLFVSHNMNAIEQLCTQAILLDEGNLAEQGSTNKVINAYLARSVFSQESSYWENKDNKLGNQFFRPIRFFVADKRFKPTKVIRSDETSSVVIEFESEEKLSNLMIGYRLSDEENHIIYTTTHVDSSPEKWPFIRKGPNVFYSRLPKRLLKEGRYRLELVAKPHGSKWIIGPSENSPTVFLTIQGGSSDSPYWSSRKQNLVVPIIQWKNK